MRVSYNFLIELNKTSYFFMIQILLLAFFGLVTAACIKVLTVSAFDSTLEEKF
jgi:hypothetical protein